MLEHRPSSPQAHVETGPPPESPRCQYGSQQALSLIILWSAREPHRSGEAALCEQGMSLVLGRAPVLCGGERAVCFAPRRPVPAAGTPPAATPELLGEALSRRQIEIYAEGESLRVRNVGRCPMWVNGVLTGRAQVGHGDTIHLQQQLLLLCVRRSVLLPELRLYPSERLGAFGRADRDGIVGESAAVWLLREQIASSAGSEGSVLVLGPSGAGKELVAQALHALSRRKHRPLVAENIAAMPTSLGAALLFGNKKNFPNPGMEERVGLLGQAEGGTLFLDEIGDMSSELQPLLLRVMERSGEYLRLGDESHPRRANVRFIAATNHPERVRLELRRRFQHEIVVPDLHQRIEDIPLLARHLLFAQADRCARTARFLCGEQARLDPRLLEQLVRHRYSTHVSELAFLLLRAVQESERDVLLPLTPAPPAARAPEPAATAAVPESPSTAAVAVPTAPQPLAARKLSLPTPVEAQRALDAAGGSVLHAAANLRITRHQLNRLIRREGLHKNRPERAACRGLLKPSLD